MGFWDFLKSRSRPEGGRILKHNLTSEKEDSVRDNWRRIEELLKVGRPSQLKQAVIESDKVLDSVLKELTDGENMGLRLKAARQLFADREVYESLWKAHKIRNALVHESSYDPPYYVCREAVEKYKQALLSLNIRI